VRAPLFACSPLIVGTWRQGFGCKCRAEAEARPLAPVSVAMTCRVRSLRFMLIGSLTDNAPNMACAYHLLLPIEKKDEMCFGVGEPLLAPTADLASSPEGSYITIALHLCQSVRRKRRAFVRAFQDAARGAATRTLK